MALCFLALKQRSASASRIRSSRSFGAERHMNGACVSQAEAGYGYGYGGYGYHYRPHYSYSYSYCHYESRPVTIRVWDDYSYSYIYRTIYRSYKIC
jgi:hypothetical protein